jgi:phosphonate transport system substrate-binding protein
MRSKHWLLIAATLGLLAQPALAAQWQDTHKALRVGFLAIDGAAYDLRKLEPFRAYIQASVGMPVELVPAVSYAALIDAQATDRVQYAIHSATSYVTTAAQCRCIDPVAVPTAFNGARGFHSIILARADSGITALRDAAGKTLAVSSGDSIAGRLVPLKYLAREGIDPSTHFGSLVEASDPAAAIAALQSGSVDLAVGWSSLTGNPAAGYDFGVLTSLVQARTLSMEGVRIVWQSPLIPFGPHALRSDVPEGVKAGLLTALTAMASASPVALDAVDRSPTGGGGFAPVSASDYAVVADLIGTDVAGLSGLTPAAPPFPPVPPPSGGAAASATPPAPAAPPVVPPAR